MAEITNRDKDNFNDVVEIYPKVIKCDKSTVCRCDDCRRWVYEPSSTARSFTS